MDILKKILYALIGVLVVIVAAGGAYLGLNSGQMNHGNSQQVAQNQQTPGTGNTETGGNQQKADQNSQDPSKDQQADPNQNPQGHGTMGQHNQTPGQDSQVNAPNGPQQPQTPGPNGQQQQPQTPAAYPPAPPIRVIDPEPYYDRINKAQEIIEDANKMITVDPFANSGTDAANSGADMAKLHQGISKMSQGMVIMQDTLDKLNKEIKGDARFAPSPDQPVYPGYYPYRGYNQQNWPYGYNQSPYGYNPQYPYNQAPGTPYPQPQQPQQSNQTQPNNQTNSNSQNNPNSQNNQQNHQTMGNQASNPNTGITANLFGDLSFQKILTYGAYGILVASVVGVFIAILGMVNSMFKKPNQSQN